ncbi:hypothetical protein VTO42DRAFT_3098 [Malbranchea cinnamomea]
MMVRLMDIIFAVLICRADKYILQLLAASFMRGKSITTTITTIHKQKRNSKAVARSTIHPFGEHICF